MKKLCVALCVAVLFLVSARYACPAEGVNVHMYAIENVKEDSAVSTAWLIQANDVDTSQVMTTAIYANFATALHFGCAGTAHADSLDISVYWQISFDNVTWAHCDSIAVADITVAKVVAMSPDSTFIKKWTTTPAPYSRIIIAGWADNHKAAGWNVTVKTIKQQ